MYQPITALGLLSDALAPISIENILETRVGNWLGLGTAVQTESEVAQIAGIVADIVGLGANTYGIAEKDVGKSDALKEAEFELAWKLDRNPANIKPAKTSAIMKKLSGAKQERAVADFAKQYNEQATRLVNSSEYQKMSLEEKSQALTKVRESVNKAIKKKYGLK